MSKCQMNKYRPGGRCGGSSASKETSKENPEFNSSLAFLLQKREEQNALFHAAPVQAQPQETIVVKKTVAKDKPLAKDDYINIIMEGDYE